MSNVELAKQVRNEEMLSRFIDFMKKGGWLVLVSVGLFILGAQLVYAEESATPTVDYRDIPGIGSRNAIWIIAQLHILFAGFVLGVPMFALTCEYIGYKTGDMRYDKLAKEFTKLLTASFGTTATFGAILLFFLVGMYPKLFNYLSGVFFPTFVIYAFLFILETIVLYIYWYGWDYMAGRKKLHLFMGLLLNLVGLAIMWTADAWLSFQASPVVLSENMGYWQKLWAAVHNPTWNPVNIHRVIGNVVLGGFMCGAYAGVRYLGAKTQAEREHYDWMGYIGNFIGIFGLLPLPFAGYWLMREVYEYNQQMGITLMGGSLSWLFILQAIQIGVLFLGANYYFWQGLAYRAKVGPQYKKYILAMVTVLILCFAVWLTPHSLVASLSEARAMGGTHHPLLGVFGVMSAKLTVVNLMILTTFISFILYWRANKEETAGWAKASRVFQYGLFFVAAVVVISLGVYGYYVPAVVRVKILSTAQVLTVLFVLLTVTPLTALSLKSAKATGSMTWGVMPNRSQYVLISNGILVILTMTLMGYVRSASRVHFHIYGVMRDASAYAFTPTVGFAASLMALITFIFCLIVLFIFWVAGLQDKAKKKTDTPEPISSGEALLAAGDKG
jgi:cytochrome bd-type quinol oxidase subunit 1